jgi:hypothetical protein
MPDETLKKRVASISAKAVGFCEEKLNDDYAELVKKLIGKLSRKRPSPLLRGKEEIWAASIVHAIGFVNFLYDRSSKPYVTFNELNDYFGTKQTTVTSKAAEIRTMFKMERIFGFEYMTERSKESNPLYDTVMVNGMLLPISLLPAEHQQMVRAIKAKGGKINLLAADPEPEQEDEG